MGKIMLAVVVVAIAAFALYYFRGKFRV